MEVDGPGGEPLIEETLRGGAGPRVAPEGHDPVVVPPTTRKAATPEAKPATNPLITVYSITEIPYRALLFSADSTEAEELDRNNAGQRDQRRERRCPQRMGAAPASALDGNGFAEPHGRLLDTDHKADQRGETGDDDLAGLGHGDTGERIKYLQVILMKAGFPPPCTGRTGTTAARRRPPY
ncbi:hypothetical protein [Nocardiopsis baichengensis]|uniref:hypothetical protein n=1 Tax=Nocardiopsis baichengensis TaxID=280240 RepID=UPI001268815C|nr:hypothetical protein [Nocardiopsis baichengensis]